MISKSGGDSERSVKLTTGPVREIDPKDQSSSAGKWLVTIGGDWAHDDGLGGAIDLFEQAEITAAWLITDDKKWTERPAGNPLFELDIHPNFNSLREGGDGTH